MRHHICKLQLTLFLSLSMRVEQQVVICAIATFPHAVQNPERYFSKSTTGKKGFAIKLNWLRETTPIYHIQLRDKKCSLQFSNPMLLDKEGCNLFSFVRVIPNSKGKFTHKMWVRREPTGTGINVWRYNLRCKLSVIRPPHLNAAFEQSAQLLYTEVWIHMNWNSILHAH